MTKRQKWSGKRKPFETWKQLKFADGRPRRFTQTKENNVKHVFAAAAILSAAASPSLAWHPINIYNNTDPAIISGVEFTAGGTSPVPFVLNVLPKHFQTFGPVPEGGPCMRYVTVKVTSPGVPGFGAFTAKTPMDVCREGWINVTGYWPSGVGTSPIVVTHGFGPGPAGPPTL